MGRRTDEQAALRPCTRCRCVAALRPHGFRGALRFRCGRLASSATRSAWPPCAPLRRGPRASVDALDRRLDAGLHRSHRALAGALYPFDAADGGRGFCCVRLVACGLGLGLFGEAPCGSRGSSGAGLALASSARRRRAHGDLRRRWRPCLGLLGKVAPAHVELRVSVGHQRLLAAWAEGYGIHDVTGIVAGTRGHGQHVDGRPGRSCGGRAGTAWQNRVECGPSLHGTHR